MQGLVCDRCGATLLLESDVRYQVRIEVLAAYDPMEITRADLERDLEGEMKQLLESMENMDPADLESQVYRRFEFDLCPHCQREYLRDPLGAGRSDQSQNES